jgi:hypothetical protein
LGGESVNKPQFEHTHIKNLTIDRYGIYTANFKPPPSLCTDDLFKYLIGAIEAGVAINGTILTVPDYLRTKKQSKTLSANLNNMNDKYNEFCDKSKAVDILDSFMVYVKLLSIGWRKEPPHSQYKVLDDKFTEYSNSIINEK